MEGKEGQRNTAASRFGRGGPVETGSSRRRGGVCGMQEPVGAEEVFCAHWE